MTKRQLILFFTLIGIFSVSLFLFFSRHVFPFTMDSLIYVSTALRIKAGDGLFYTNFHVLPVNLDFLPLQLHPPGYPFLICSLNVFGFGMVTAARLIPFLLYTLLPMAFYLVLKHIMNQRLALITAFCGSMMFSVLKSALFIWSDIPFLFFSLLSLFFLFQAEEKEKKEKILFSFCAGLCAGGAVLIRFIGLSLFLSVVFCLVLFSLLKKMTWKDFLRSFLGYGVGFSLLEGPFLVRNVIVFGTIQPYQLPPAQSSLTTNMLDYFNTLSSMMVGTPAWGIICFFLLAGMLILYGLRFRWLLRSSPHLLFRMTVLISYFIFGSVLLLATKTIYFLAERINDRYLIQFAWLFLSGLVYCVHTGLTLRGKRNRLILISVASALVSSFLLLQLLPAKTFLSEQQKVKALAEKIGTYTPLVKTIPEGYPIVTNIPDLVCAKNNRNARFLNGFTPSGLAQAFEGQREFAVLLIKPPELTYTNWQIPATWQHPSGYDYAYQDQYIDLLYPHKK